MKINELMEAMPGVKVSGRERRRFNKSQEEAIKNNARQGITTWLSMVKKLSLQGDINDSTPTQDYVERFIDFVADKAKIDPEHPKLKDIGNNLIKTLDASRGSKAAGQQALYTSMEQIIRSNIAGDFKRTASAAEPAAIASPAAKLAPGVTVISRDPIAIKFDKKIYALGSQGEWVTLRDKKPVNDPTLLAILDKQHEIIDKQR